MWNQRRQAAWAYGRALRNQLVCQYREEYGVDVPPPPAMIVDELLTDMLQVTLRFDPLPLQVFAQTEWKDNRPVVTVNSLTEQIPGVKDAAGVQNVAKFHEVVHVDRDLPELKSGPQGSFPGFGPPTRIVCHRGFWMHHFEDPRRMQVSQPNSSSREFWAEEAGRAAAVSHDALSRSEGFQALMALEPGFGPARNAERWRLLNRAALDIGVNSSALSKQLVLEGRIVIVKEGGRSVLYLQPSLLAIAAGGS